MNKKILVVGSANMDLSLNVYRTPELGETLIDDGGVAYIPGGRGANAAIAFTRLGADTTFCAKLGADVHGQQLYKFYREQGLDTSAIKVDRDFSTGFSAVIKESDGQNRTICYPGANTHITADSIISAFDSDPDVLYTNFEISFQTALTAAKIAAQRGVPIVIDAAPADKSIPLEALPYVEIFSPNDTEVHEMTGIMPSGADSSLRAALAIWRRTKCKYIVIKQGSRGVSVYDGKKFDMIPACRPDRIVDTATAGDTFTAAMTLEYIRTGDIKEAARYGAAAAAVAISRPGASSSIPTADEVRRFIALKGF
jgi:ribokinase